MAERLAQTEGELFLLTSLIFLVQFSCAPHVPTPYGAVSPSVPLFRVRCFLCEGKPVPSRRGTARMSSWMSAAGLNLQMLYAACSPLFQKRGGDPAKSRVG